MTLSHVEGAILAGGASSRMGRDKATLPFRGRPMVARVAAALSACVRRVRVVVRPGTPPPAGLPTIEDRLGVRAPIAGIHAALAESETGVVLVAACDLPELEPRLLLALLALAPTEGGADAVVPCGPSGPEPLLGIYRVGALAAIERQVSRERLSLRALLEEIETLEVPVEELRPFDPELRSLSNVNRPADLDASERSARD